MPNEASLGGSPVASRTTLPKPSQPVEPRSQPTSSLSADAAQPGYFLHFPQILPTPPGSDPSARSAGSSPRSAASRRLPLIPALPGSCARIPAEKLPQATPHTLLPPARGYAEPALWSPRRWPQSPTHALHAPAATLRRMPSPAPSRVLLFVRIQSFHTICDCNREIKGICPPSAPGNQPRPLPCHLQPHPQDEGLPVDEGVIELDFDAQRYRR